MFVVLIEQMKGYKIFKSTRTLAFVKLPKKQTDGNEDPVLEENGTSL
jgi:hypothetical protein